MALNFDLKLEVVEGQIGIVRRIMRLPRLTQKERLYLSELLKILYAFRKELAMPKAGESINLTELMRLNSMPDVIEN